MKAPHKALPETLTMAVNNCNLRIVRQLQAFRHRSSRCSFLPYTHRRRNAIQVRHAERDTGAHCSTALYPGPLPVPSMHMLPSKFRACPRERLVDGEPWKLTSLSLPPFAVLFEFVHRIFTLYGIRYRAIYCACVAELL